MRLIFVPFSIINFWILRPNHFPFTLFFVIYIISLVLPAIIPSKSAYPIHFSFFPLPFKSFSILPLIKTYSMNHVIFKFSFIWTAISPQELSFTLSLSHHKITNIGRHFLRVFSIINIFSKSMKQTILPLSFIHITISMDNSSIIRCFIILP